MFFTLLSLLLFKYIGSKFTFIPKISTVKEINLVPGMKSDKAWGSLWKNHP